MKRRQIVSHRFNDSNLKLKGSAIALVLSLGMGFSGIDVEAQAPLTPPEKSDPTVSIPASIDVATDAPLTTTLHDARLNFSILNIKPTNHLKGILQVVPIHDDTSDEIFQAILADKNQPYLLLPMLTKPNDKVDVFLKALGFTPDGSQILSDTLPLVIAGETENTSIPAGTFVIKTTDRPLAYWGPTYPAAILPQTGTKTLLLNWNWQQRFPTTDFNRLLSAWQMQDKSLQPILKANNRAHTKPIIISSADLAKLVTTTTSPLQTVLPDKPITTPIITVLPVESTPATSPSPPPASAVSTPETPAAVTDVTLPVASPSTSNSSSIPEEPKPIIIQAIPPTSPVTASTDTPNVTLPSVTASSASLTIPTTGTTAFVAPTPPPIPSSTPSGTTPPSSAVVTATSQTGEHESYPDDLYDFDRSRGHVSIPTNGIQAEIAEFYNDRMREFGNLSSLAQQQANAFSTDPVKSKKIQTLIDQAEHGRSAFEYQWFQGNYFEALSSFEKSKGLLLLALFDKVPISQVEGRAIWVDRGSIVAAHDAVGLRKLIDRIVDSGFNILYFETLNAGYPVYPSTIIEQNPQTKGWDPLAVAVDEAHKQGVELHAWVWVFAVGNTRHNKILGAPDSYPGPILSQPGMLAEALRGRNGQLIPPDQYEYWLSPASIKGRALLTSVYSEIVKNYAVDGLQLDYIRYPFQKAASVMGLEPFAIARFNTETNLVFQTPNAYTRQAWTAWKAYQVSSFVRDIHATLKAINPNLKLSAAVFPLARNARMQMIQQDWETWIKNGWLDTLNPMAYSRSSLSLQHLVNYIHNIGEDKALVYPGLSLTKLNDLELLNTLDICKATGVMGTTLFAVKQLDDTKIKFLDIGPYRMRTTMAPHSNPIAASNELINETDTLLLGLIQTTPNTPQVAQWQTIHTQLQTLSDDLKGISTRPLMGAIGTPADSTRDAVRVLETTIASWKDLSPDTVIGYQTQTVKEMLEKVVRVVNYATYTTTHISPPPLPADTVGVKN